MDELRERIERGDATFAVEPLLASDLDRIAWSGSPSHIENVRQQLLRVGLGEVDYLMLCADGVPVAKGGVDYAAVTGAGTLWQLATMPELEGLGLMSKLVAAAEDRIAARELMTVRLAVEVDNDRARKLYERLGYVACGESPESWESEDENGNLITYRTSCTQMVKQLHNRG